MPLPESGNALRTRVKVVPLSSKAELKEARGLLKEHHYLGSAQTVGERIYYAIRDHAEPEEWLGVMVFAAAARRLRHRDQWIGWSDEQRRRRLCLVANNVRFLLLPHKAVANLGSVVMKKVLQRLSKDWQERYDHPILVVESFVDPEHFKGSVYRASNWIELGQTQGHGRKAKDYYERHGKPKQLFVRALQRNACRSLQAEQLKPSLAAVEAKTKPRCTHRSTHLQALAERFKSVPEYHKMACNYPLYALLSIMAAAHLAGAPRGQKDLAVFARSLSQAQRRALGIRRRAGQRHYPAPSQATFSRMMSQADIKAVEAVLLDWQKQIRGEPDRDELIAIDGKIPKHSGGQNVVSAITAGSVHYLGCEVVADKSNEIPAARRLFKRLDLDGKLVSLDALHTQDQTALELLREHGADYLLTVKDNQKNMRAQIERLCPDPASPLLSPPNNPALAEKKAWKKENRSPVRS